MASAIEVVLNALSPAEGAQTADVDAVSVHNTELASGRSSAGVMLVISARAAAARDYNPGAPGGIDAT